MTRETTLSGVDEMWAEDAARRVAQFLDEHADATGGLKAALNPDRLYAGQPWTDAGDRGAVLVEGLTFRDIGDCFVIACYESSGLDPKDWPRTIYELPWDEMDPVAIRQNLACAIERRMGIFPNVDGSKGNRR